MSSHLLAIEIGPVEEFIAAARRTRDLWFGSWVLSEIAKAAAKAIADACGENGYRHLIFPAPQRLSDLDASSQLAVADVLLAEVPENLKNRPVRDVARAATDAVQRRWMEFADQALEMVRERVQVGVWNSQVRDVVEAYAAWVPMDDGDSYATARQRLMRLLGGRTNCRNFAAAGQPEPGSFSKPPSVPKSSLDGARETVLLRGDMPLKRGVESSPVLRLAEGEELDVPGVVKRVAGGRATYPSVSRIAADPWLRGVMAAAAQSEKLRDELTRLIDNCRTLIGSPVFSPVDLGRFAQYSSFPFDGTAVFRERHPEQAKELRAMVSESSRRSEWLNALDRLGESLQQLKRLGNLDEPDPYLAVLVADGDNMGTTLGLLRSAEAHRQFSKRLAEFAGQANQIVAGHQGALVYSGGDDVLALVPVDQAIACAEKLRTAFARLLGDVSPAGTKATLSVGVSIGHFLESLEDLVNWGRDAERRAKARGSADAKNGLGVRVEPRGGAPVVLRRQWQDGENNPAARLQLWADLLREGRLPDKAAFDLRRLELDYRHWQNASTLGDALRADIRRVLRAKRSDRAAGGIAKVAELVDGVHNVPDLLDLCNEIIIARRIAKSQRQAEPRKSEGSG